MYNSERFCISLTVLVCTHCAGCLNTLTWHTCAAPVIMLGMKSLCPGASMRVTTLEFVSNLVTPTSIVTPLEQTQINKGFFFTPFNPVFFFFKGMCNLYSNLCRSKIKNENIK